MMKLFSVFLFICVCGVIQEVQASIRDKYCGLDDCYDIMNVTRDATTNEIRKSHRRLAVRYHPDKNREPGAEDRFKMINHAYQILTDPALRATYDEFLDNPNEAEYYAYYKYYEAKYSPKVDPRLVVGSFLVLFSAFQYFNKKRMYENAVQYIEKTSRFQAVLKQKMEEDRYQNPKSTKTREDFIEELKKSVKIHGGYAIPKMTDLVLFQFLLLPYKIARFFYFHIRWLILFTILKKPYGLKEKQHITKKRLGIKDDVWNQADEGEMEEWMQNEVWINGKYVEYLARVKEEQRQRLAGNNKYKQYKRFKKYN